MTFRVVIPARHASTRLPGKPLRLIAGQTMIERVWRQALQSGAVEVVIATDDERIAATVRALGARCVMTRADHPSGTDRIAEVARLAGWPADALVVNVQGDEPLIPPVVVRQVAALLEGSPECGLATLCEPLLVRARRDDPNVVKVVRAGTRALYFSRSPVPCWRDDPGTGELPAGRWFRHIGIYAYRVDALAAFTAWPPGSLETLESLEQLRFLENRVAIAVDDAAVEVPGGVDTEADLQRVAALLGASPPG